MPNDIGRFITKRANLNPRTEAGGDVTNGTRLTHPPLNARANKVPKRVVRDQFDSVSAR